MTVCPVNSQKAKFLSSREVLGEKNKIVLRNARRNGQPDARNERRTSGEPRNGKRDGRNRNCGTTGTPRSNKTGRAICKRWASEEQQCEKQDTQNANVKQVARKEAGLERTGSEEVVRTMLAEYSHKLSHTKQSELHKKLRPPPRKEKRSYFKTN